MSDPVSGSLRVEICAQPDTAVESAYYSARVSGVVNIDGVTSRPVTFDCTVPAKRCPRSGQTVPVIVDRTDPCRIVIVWKRVPIRPERRS